jgi:predicted nucleic acid-binding protein
VTTWIVNASPLILLGKINRLDLLAALAPSLVIPAAVRSEILAGPDLDSAKAWIKSAYGSAHVMPEVPLPTEILAWDLGAGETAVLALASTRTSSVCVLDDLAARNCAAVFQIPVIGTLGILLKAKVGGLIPRLKPEIELLLTVGSLLSPSLIQQALTLAGEPL